MTLAAKDELFANWAGRKPGPTAAVVRPDRYVYGVAGSAPDSARLVGELGGALFVEPRREHVLDLAVGGGAAATPGGKYRWQALALNCA